MTGAEALARLTMMVAPAEDPVLSGAELQILLDDALVVDYYGLPPRSPAGVATTGYTSTWNLRQAARKGWEAKAAKVASRYDFSAAVHSHSRDQLMKHCQAMIELYSKGDIGTIQTGGSCVYDPVIGNLNGAA